MPRKKGNFKRGLLLSYFQYVITESSPIKAILVPRFSFSLRDISIGGETNEG